MDWPAGTPDAAAEGAGFSSSVMEPEDAALWHGLRLTPDDVNIKEKLVTRYLPLVKAEAERLCAHLPSHFDRQELFAEGVVGLLAAISNFEPDQGVLFASYARKRVWGAMMDRVRTQDGIPRSARKAARALKRGLLAFLNRSGRQPDEAELAGELKVSLEELHELERQACLAQTLSLDASGDPSASGSASTLAGQLADDSEQNRSPLDRLAAQELQAQLVDGLKSLPERERAIVVLYYQQGLMLREIAAALEVSESRVSQLHNRALLRLRAFLEKGKHSGTK